MLRGHVFKFQTFANEAFAHFINIFLNGNMGITKGCDLSYTNNSVTISSGYFCVCGRFLEIIGNETISNISDRGYYSLVCEIDLSKINTEANFLQGAIKIIRDADAYPSLIQENLFNGGNVYQYEFARFRIINSGITNFEDTRTFLNFDSLYEKLEEELQKARDESLYVLKSDVYYTNFENSFVPNIHDSFLGFITGEGKDLCFIIKTPKKLDLINYFVINSLKLTIRGIDGYVGTIAQDFSSYLNGYEILSTKDGVHIELHNDRGWGMKNNTPITVSVGHLGDVQLTFYNSNAGE